MKRACKKTLQSIIKIMGVTSNFNEKRIILFFVLFVFAAANTIAQEVIATAGKAESSSDCQVSWTLGETVIETAEAGSSVLTQGFHQSKLTITAIDKITEAGFDLKVYPNPTQDFVIVHFSKLNGQPTYQLIDLNGKLIEQQKISTTDVKINMRSFAEGAYLLKLINKNQNQLQTFKIIKN